jgi:hypothetical protein
MDCNDIEEEEGKKKKKLKISGATLNCGPVK